MALSLVSLKEFQMNLRSLFLQHVGQTSVMPMMLEVAKAEGMYIYDQEGKAFLDLNSGISVSSLGHRHPKVVEAITDQLGKHMHTMVYGEHIHTPQVLYASTLAKALDNGLDAVYYVNCGTEAVEVAMKLARRATGRRQILSCKNAYHGSTMGAEALRSDYEFTRTFFPSIPDVDHITFNDESDLENITHKTACIILEAVQAEAGIRSPKDDYLIKVRKRCDEVGALMILDEIQTGFGRTGHLFAHKKYGFVPDVLLIAKGMGGGMPIGGVVASKNLLDTFTKKPALGHITTFGGHPVCVAAAMATLDVLLADDQGLVQSVLEKEKLIHELLVHEIIQEIRSDGLMMAVELTKRKYLKHVVEKTISNGALIDFFLFDDRSFRLAPPLIITEQQIREGVDKILSACDYAKAQYR